MGSMTDLIAPTVGFQEIPFSGTPFQETPLSSWLADPCTPVS
jgi:hypothetical protein